MHINIKDIRFENEDIDNFINAFTDESGNKGWKIKVSGKFVKTNSGKSLWVSRGAAKNALKQHFYSMPMSQCLLDKLYEKYLNEKYPQYIVRNKLWNFFVDSLEAMGILEFVELK